HVAFARLAKFDGRGLRRLSAAEIGQIAGRAGRHMNDGTFGTTADEGPLDPEIVGAVEAHKFEPLTRIAWRTPARPCAPRPDGPPPAPALIQTRDADDHQVLRALSRHPEAAALASNPAA